MIMMILRRNAVDNVQLLAHNLPVATAIGVKVFAVLIPNLSAALAASILTALDEAGVPVAPDNPIVETGAIYPLHRLEGVLAVVKLYEAEAAGRSAKLVQADDDAPDLAAPTKEVVDLLLRRVEGQVAHVEGRRFAEFLFLFLSRSLWRKEE